MEKFQKHRKQSADAAKQFNLVTSPQLTATFNSMRAECHWCTEWCNKLTQEYDDASQHSDDYESDDAHLHTGDTTGAETDLDETEDEESDPEYDHDDGDYDRATDRHP